jgi:hypothetical protein
MVGGQGIRVLAAVIAVITVTATGCSGVSVVPSDRPEDVQASDGGYPGSILVSWDAPDSTKVIDEYRIDRTGGNDVPTTARVDAAARSYRDESIRSIGVVYSYRVIALFEDGSTGASFPDTGYALESTDIQVGSVPGSYSREYNTTNAVPEANETVWFRFLAQQGWTYEVHLTGSPVGVRVLGEAQLDPAPTTVPVTGDYAFTPNGSGIHYLEVRGGQGEVSVTHR